MNRKYKFYNKEGLYFVSFATVNWIDVFVRDVYFDTLYNSLDYCRKNKGMGIYAYCIMTSHVHLIFRAKEGNPSELLGSFKSFTSKQLRKAIETNPQESRAEWLIEIMKSKGMANSNVQGFPRWCDLVARDQYLTPRPKPSCIKFKTSELISGQDKDRLKKNGQRFIALNSITYRKLDAVNF